MKKIVKLDDGSCWVANTKTDEKIYDAPVNPPNTGNAYTRGEDLYVHRTKNHGDQFYVLGWSMWQGEGESITELTKEEAIEFLKDKVGDYWNFPDEKTATTLKEKFGIDVLEETA